MIARVYFWIKNISVNIKNCIGPFSNSFRFNRIKKMARFNRIKKMPRFTYLCNLHHEQI